MADHTGLLRVTIGMSTVPLCGDGRWCVRSTPGCVPTWSSRQPSNGDDTRIRSRGRQRANPDAHGRAAAPEPCRATDASAPLRAAVQCLSKDFELAIAGRTDHTHGYRDRPAAEAGHLVVFDRAPERTRPTRSSAMRHQEMASRSRSRSCSTGKFRPAGQCKSPLSRTIARSLSRIAWVEAARLTVAKRTSCPWITPDSKTSSPSTAG